MIAAVEYQVEYDTIYSGCFVDWITEDNIGNVVKQVRECLKLHGGGHADILRSEDESFVTDVEV